MNELTMSFAGCKSRQEAHAKLRDFVAAHQLDWLRVYRSNLLACDRDLDVDTVDELCEVQRLLLGARLELALYRACDVAGATETRHGEVQPVPTAPTSRSTHDRAHDAGS